MAKKKYPVTIRLDISPTSQSKRTEGLDILSRIIARNIISERLCPPGEEDHRDKDKEIEN